MFTGGNFINLSEAQVAAATEFQKQFYSICINKNNTGIDCAQFGIPVWMGTPVMTLAFDLLILQEIIYDTRPDVIIECGTADGGTAIFFATMCEMVRHGNVITIDHEKRKWVPHPGITYVVSDTLDPATLEQVTRYANLCEKVMVFLDDNHQKAHVMAELDAYGPLVKEGCYLVVADTSLNGHPCCPEYGPGPWEALEEWLPKHPEFQVDRNRERFGVTGSPGGYLKKVAVG